MRCAALFGYLALAASVAAADEVRLANGDRISGEVKGQAGGKLVVITSHAGEVALDTAQVVSVTVVGPDGTAREVALADIAAVDAPPAHGGAAYAGLATVSAAYTSGNVESERLYADAELTARARAYRWSLSGKVEQREDPVLGDNTAWLAGGNYDHFLDERRFVYARTSIEHDESKDIDRRAALGAGYGVQLYETARAQLSVRAGLDYVTVERIAGPNEGYPAAGWGVKGSFRPRGPKLELFHEQEGFWNLEDSDALVLRSKTGLRMPLVARINASVQLNVDWERRPAPGRASTDRTLLLGLDYTW
jgi:putative salt-induced outer membrane protein YdiY